MQRYEGCQEMFKVVVDSSGIQIGAALRMRGVYQVRCTSILACRVQVCGAATRCAVGPFRPLVQHAGGHKLD